MTEVSHHPFMSGKVLATIVITVTTLKATQFGYYMGQIKKHTHLKTGKGDIMSLDDNHDDGKCPVLAITCLIKFSL
jgi:hypothetical protein